MGKHIGDRECGEGLSASTWVDRLLVTVSEPKWVVVVVQPPAVVKVVVVLVVN